MTRIIDLDSARYAVEEEGAGPLVIFGHSLCFGRELFEAQAHALSPRFRCVRPDFPGHGLSTGNPGGWDMWDLVEDLRALIDRLGGGKVILIGVSQGAGVFGRFAARYPEAVEALVLMAANPDAFPPAAIERVTAQAAILARRDPAEVEAMLKGVLTRNLSPYTLANRAEVVAKARSIVFGHDPAGLAQAVRVPLSYDALGAHLKSVTAPAMVLWGADDQTVPPSLVDTYRALMPGLRVALVEKAGHALPLEQPEQVAALIGDFLKPFERG